MYQLRFQILLRYIDRLAYGVFLAISITFASLLIGAVIGLVMALMRTRGNLAFRRVATAYVEFFRNIPLLLIIIFIFFGLPLMGIQFLDKFASVTVAMSLYAGAYLTEIFRAGIESIESRFIEAGQSIGLTSSDIVRYVILPLMFAESLPALSNLTISLFKDSSLAAAASVPEITFVGRVINTDTWRIVEAWTAVAGIYLGVSYFMALLLRRVERSLLRWR